MSVQDGECCAECGTPFDPDSGDCTSCLVDGLRAQLATATEAAEAARSQLAVAVEALETIARYGEDLDEKRAREALAKLRAAKEGR